mgnify:CR=1 FL=1
MHRAVHIAHEVNQHTQAVEMLLLAPLATLYLLDNRMNGRQYIALGMARLRLQRFALVNVHVVPGLRVGILGGVAGVVHPIRIVNQRAATQHRAYLLGSGRRQMTFGNVGDNVVSLLSPCKGIEREGYTGNQQ